MTYTTRYTGDGGILRVGEGVVTGAQILASAVQDNQDLARAQLFRYGFVDFTTATKVDATAAQIRAIAEENARTAVLAPRVVVAIVAPSDHIYGIARMWEFHADAVGWETWVFRDRATAIAWLRERCPGAIPDQPA
jgi:hypothetical protein